MSPSPTFSQRSLARRVILSFFVLSLVVGVAAASASVSVNNITATSCVTVTSNADIYCHVTSTPLTKTVCK
jgi:hypothetical protein